MYFVKYSDEGTNSPFVARMFSGILEIRDLYINTNGDPRNKQITLGQFNKFYEPIRNSLEISLISTRALTEICSELSDAGRKGELTLLHPGGGFSLTNTKGPFIQKEFATVIEQSAIAIKNHLPRLVEYLFELKIGFLFQNEANFVKAMENLNNQNLSPLVQYFQSVRMWTDLLINGIWNKTKHSDWKLRSPDLKIIQLPEVQVNLPRVFDTPVDIFSLQTINWCCLLVEDLLVYGFNFHRFSPIRILEIPKEERIHHQKKRFQAYPKFQAPAPFGPIFDYESLEII